MRGRFKGLMARVKWKLVAAIIAETKRLRETIRRAPRKRAERGDVGTMAEKERNASLFYGN